MRTDAVIVEAVEPTPEVPQAFSRLEFRRMCDGREHLFPNLIQKCRDSPFSIHIADPNNKQAFGSRIDLSNSVAGFSGKVNLTIVTGAC